MDQRRHSSESAANRRREDGHAPALNPPTLALLDTLPPTLRLLRLRSGFPHVLVRLAARWADPLAMLGEFRALLAGADRPHRQGLPADVATEVRALARYYFRIVHPQLDDLYCDND